MRLNRRVNTLCAPRVWCEIAIESGTIWVEDSAPDPGEICLLILKQSPRFAAEMEPEAVARILATVDEGVSRLRKGGAEAFTLCPLVTEGYSWDPESNRFLIHVCSAIWNLVKASAKGDVDPLAYRELSRLYYQALFCPFVERFLLREVGAWSFLPSARVSREAASAMERCFNEMRRALPIGTFQELLQSRLGEGLDTGDAFRDTVERMMRAGEREGLVTSWTLGSQL